MFERFTERARRAIFFARYEASQFGSPYIMPEHLLLGIIRDSPEVRAALIGSKSDDEIRRRIEESLGKRPTISTSVDLPLSDPAKRVLAYAAEELEQLRHWHLNEIHLMLGLRRESGTLAATIILDHGITLDSLRALASKDQGGQQVRPNTMSLFDLIIDAAEQQAAILKQSPNLEHLLLAILVNRDSLAAKILQRHGITHESLREELKRGSKD